MPHAEVADSGFSCKFQAIHNVLVIAQGVKTRDRFASKYGRRTHTKEAS